jgi:hypothetical protein
MAKNNLSDDKPNPVLHSLHKAGEAKKSIREYGKMKNTYLSVSDKCWIAIFFNHLI